MNYIVNAWDAVTPETIADSLRHCCLSRSGACSTSEVAVPVDDEPEFRSLELPGSFADYAGAEGDVAVCCAESMDIITETVCLDSAIASNKGEIYDTAEASADALWYIDNIRGFACTCDEIGDLLPNVATLERKPIRRD